jgi:pimeloyl-ACP methyl ester carboxylesterase
MKNLVLLIPGNPSVPGIYDPFLNEAVTQFNLHGEVVAKVLPHLGQCNERLIKRRKITVRDVIDDHKKNIRALISTHAPDRIILVGHSLGSAVTISLYDDLGHVIDEFFVLCPFMGPSENNKGYLRLFKNPISRMGMKGITYTGLKNERISHEIFRRWLGETPFTKHIPREISKPFYIKNFFSLVSTYFEEFEELQVTERVKRMKGDHSFFIFAPNDYWVPEETIRILPSEIPHKRLDNISHDFCLRQQEYKVVAAELGNHLSQKL